MLQSLERQERQRIKDNDGMKCDIHGLAKITVDRSVTHCDKPSTFLRDFGVDEQSVQFGLECAVVKTIQGQSFMLVKCYWIKVLQQKNVTGQNVAEVKCYRVKVLQ
jgi:hypothetical protein